MILISKNTGNTPIKIDARAMAEGANNTSPILAYPFTCNMFVNAFFNTMNIKVDWWKTPNYYLRGFGDSTAVTLPSYDNIIVLQM